MTEKSITDKAKRLSGGPIFRFIGGGRDGDEILITRETFFIGRSFNNNLALEDRSISRKHAVLNYQDGKYILSDLNSHKGVYINGKKISETELINRDRVKIGDVVLEFLLDRADTSRRKGWLLQLMIAAGVLIAVVVIVIIVLRQGGSLDKKIERFYFMGIQAYNDDKDIESARVYWNRVLELDPTGKTVQARNIRILLNNLSSNAGDTESR